MNDGQEGDQGGLMGIFFQSVGVQGLMKFFFMRERSFEHRGLSTFEALR